MYCKIWSEKIKIIVDCNENKHANCEIVDHGILNKGVQFSTFLFPTPPTIADATLFIEEEEESLV